MKKVLVVVDMQNDFVDGALAATGALDILPNVVREIEGFDGDIRVTMDTHGEDYMNTQEGAKLPVVHCVKGTEGWKLNGAVAAALAGREYQVYEKPTFGSTALAQDLKALNDAEGIEEIVFVGICTGICVVSNAIMVKAFLPEVPIKVKGDCCACVTEDSHNTALDAMKLCQIEII